MTTRAKPLVSSALLARGFGGRGSDFEIYTAAAVADETTELPIVRMVGSSTVKDLQGDIMTLTALQDMANGNPDLVIFLNHEYSVPDDIFGSLHGKPEIRMQGGIADLHLAAVADLSRDEPGRYPHSKAYDTYTQIKKGKIRLGSSVGCQVTQYQFLDPDDFFSGILIEHVIWVEHSIVGVPASQRAWVEQAVKGLFERSLIEGDADEARKLAPAMKSLWDGPYDTILREVESEGLRRDLARTRARGTGPQRILFDFTQNSFVLAGPKNVRKSLALEEVDALLEQAVPGVERTEEEVETKAASGKTSWPLMDIETEWTGSKAEKQIFDYAKNDDGEIQASKAKSCFLWYDPDNGDKQAGYKMPYTYIDSGSPKIVPLGVRACANVLSGGRGGGDFGGDEGAMKAKVKTLYGRINSQFKPDPLWVVPWEKDEKDMEPDTQKDIADSESDAALNRQDLGEVTVKADGSHEPFTGTHTHAHKAYGSQGGDDMHTHAHSHDGDAQHGHNHAEKHLHPQTQEVDVRLILDGEEIAKHLFLPVQKAGVETDEDGNHEPFTGKHSHKHKAFGSDDAGDDGMHAHSHSHDGDSAHKHSHSEEKSARLVTIQDGENATIRLHVTGDSSNMTLGVASDAGTTTITVMSNIPTPEQAALLGVYNSIGKQLGFPEHTLTTKCDLVPTQGDAGIVRSTLSALDDCSDAMMEIAQRADGYVDALMAMMGVPDTNNDDGSSAQPLPVLYSKQPTLIKEGREISARNKAHLQTIHDCVAAMHPEACKGVSGDGTSHQDGSTTVEDAQEEARHMGQGDSYTNLSSHVAETTKAVLLKAFEGLEAKSLVEASVQKAVDTAMHDAQGSIDLLQREQSALMQQIGRLTNMPLGRPTNLQRSVTPVSPHALDNVATYDDLLSVSELAAPKQTLAQALAQTSIIEVPITRNGSEIRTKCRRWPVGVGGAVGEGVRPPLTSAQKTLMHYFDWETYHSASGIVDVPLVDDPAERL